MAVQVTVVGGGIAGIAAALRLVESGARVTLVEGSDWLGGKLRTADDGIEAGAEMFLLRDPAGDPSAVLRLVQELGLTGRLMHPEPLPAALWLDGALRSMPTGTLLGVPGPDSDLSAVAKVVDQDQDLGGPVLGPGEDAAVGELVRARLGDEVVDRLVDPLLGGIYAGRADRLSVEATMPGLHRLLTQEHTLTGAVARALAASRAHRAVAGDGAGAGAGPSADGVSTAAGAGADDRAGRGGVPGEDEGTGAAGLGLPNSAIFGTLAGGLSELVSAAEQRLRERGAVLRLGAPVRRLRRTAAGWELAIGGVWSPADAVVLAVPAGKAARLLSEPFPGAAVEVAKLEYASVALVTLVLPPFELPELSGFLAPEGQGLTIKAATFFGRKWAHHRRSDGSVPLRASIGRAGQADLLQRPDSDLIAVTHRDLSAVLGENLPQPSVSRVQRWGGGLPQYGPGHVTRIWAVRDELAAAPIALAGAGYDGVGIPACVDSGLRAAEHISTMVGLEG